MTVVLGRDANWDLRHYHLYNAYALLAGRWDLDLAPAGVHGFLHPGLDLPYFLLTQSALNAWPRAVAVLQAGYAGLLAFLVLIVCNVACHGRAGFVTFRSAVVAAFGLTGAATISEVGTTFNDVQVGCLVIGALLALLRAAEADDAGMDGRAARLRLLAGTLGGGAVGLKLTAVIFPPALAAAALIAVGAVRGTHVSSRRRSCAAGLLLVGSILGFVIAYGPWGWFLHDRFGSPFGPFFNEAFGSPWFPSSTARDRRFLPEGLGQALIYPLLWARGDEMIVAEPWMADPRFAIGLAALLIVAVARSWRWSAQDRSRSAVAAAPSEADRAAQRAQSVVMAFLAVGYVAWLSTFSILRYAIPLEVLLGIPVWAAARAVVGQTGRGAAASVVALLGACALGTQYPDWDRQPFGQAAVASERVPLPEGALVVLVGEGVSFLAPSLVGAGVRFIGANALTTDPRAVLLERAVRRILGAHAGPLYAVMRDPELWEDPLHRVERAPARALGLVLDPSSTACRPVANNLGAMIRLCQLRPS
ncbi:MAG TPA: hypothetical protein VD970_16360 [Acetobacteraceae bacterium]|nr:hypothetical protein [Acetobacteraceae bacterium]